MAEACTKGLCVKPDIGYVTNQQVDYRLHNPRWRLACLQ